MGGGSWTARSFVDYSVKTKCATLDSLGNLSTSMSNQEMFKSRSVPAVLNPYNVMRECRDSEEHPETIPVILALDCTGSMGETAVEVAKKLNVIMTKLYDKVKDVEFMIMGIGDLYCDKGPIQISQFESDIRIAEQLDKLWFEFGGGGNLSESYTAAWYMGSRHCNLDCWKRGKKGIIITMGDERCNPYLPKNKLQILIGDTLEDGIETTTLYDEASQKFNIYHIQVNHGRNWDIDGIEKSWEFLGDNYREANMDDIADTIINIISNNDTQNIATVNSEGISW
jgi:hypothetical protein